MQLPFVGGRSLPGLVIALVLATGPAALPATAQAPKPASTAAGLPGGAQSLSETFEDWQVVCAMPQGVKRCAIGQQQTDPKTRQRVLSVEIQPKGAGAEGLLVLPFGLALDKGVTLKVGEADLTPALRFSTCLPQGCFVPLALDAKALASLRKAAEASVGAVSDSGQAVSFPVSLKGLPAAFDRAAALGS